MDSLNSFSETEQRALECLGMVDEIISDMVAQMTTQRFQENYSQFFEKKLYSLLAQERDIKAQEKKYDLKDDDWERVTADQINKLDIDYNLSLYASMCDELLSPDKELMAIHKNRLENAEADYAHPQHMHNFKTEMRKQYTSSLAPYSRLKKLAEDVFTETATPEQTRKFNFWYEEKFLQSGKKLTRDNVTDLVFLLDMPSSLAKKPLAIGMTKALTVIDKAIPKLKP